MQPALPPPLRISYFITCSFFFPQHLWPSDIQYNLLMHHVDSLMYIIRSIKMFVSFATGVLQALRIVLNVCWALMLEGGRKRRGNENTFFLPWARLDLNQSDRLICCFQPPWLKRKGLGNYQVPPIVGCLGMDYCHITFHPISQPGMTFPILFAL